MNFRQVLRILVSLVLLGSFFLPVNRGDGLFPNVSAFQFILSLKDWPSLAEFSASLLVVIAGLTLVFLLTIVVLIISLTQKPLRPWLAALPFVLLVVVIVVSLVDSRTSLIDFLESAGPGLYLMIAVSLVLTFLFDRRQEASGVE